MTANDNPRKELKTSNEKDFSQKNHVPENKHKTDCAPVRKYIGTDYSYKHKIVWKNVIGFIILHVFAIWGLGLMLTGTVSWKTSLWSK